MLSLDDDGDVEDHCDDDDINGDCGHTHYQFKAVDDNGNTVASELVETEGGLAAGSGNKGQYFQTVFTAESGDLTLSVSLGRMVGGKYKAMSDTASVMFEAPDDLRALDQTYDEYNKVNEDITAGCDEDDDVERYLDSVFASTAIDCDHIKNAGDNTGKNKDVGLSQQPVEVTPENLTRRLTTMRTWTKPVLVKLDIAETLRGSGPCPDGDGGSEAM